MGVAETNPFKSSVIGHMDAGSSHFLFSSMGLPVSFRECGERICLGINDMKGLQQNSNELRKHPWVIATRGNDYLDGAAFSGRATAYPRLLPMMKDLIVRWLRQGFINDDQVYLIELLPKQPEQFEAI